jgi:NAD(P)-dependent dehydrogenase (short-subunit alcohol dehydrogenase family)
MSNDERPLAGLRALIVGGSSGIGLATAHLLVRDGATVTLAARDENRLASARASFAPDARVLTISTDALSPADTQRAVEQACEGEQLDIAVTVPGGGSMKPVLSFEPDEFSAEVDRNVRPVFLLLKYAGGAMTSGGSIIAVSSTAAVFSSRYLASYCTGKAGVDHLVRVAADELGEVGIRVNAVRPGLTRTPGTAGMFSNDDILGRFIAGQAIDRHGEPPDIAAAIRYLAGPESSWVTGQHLTVDGGHTLRSFPDLGDLAKQRAGR